MVLAGDPPEQKIFDQYADRSDQKWRDKKRDPVIDAESVKEDDGGHGAQHVHGTMGKVNYLEQAKDNCQPEAQERIKRAINDPDQKLTSQHGKGDTENHGHVAHSKSSANAIPGIIVASSRGCPTEGKGAPKMTLFSLFVICRLPAGTCSQRAGDRLRQPG